MAMELSDPKHPFFALIGNGGKPTWSDTAAAFIAFYHLLAKGHAVLDAVARMNKAAGDELFFLETAEASRRSYQEYLMREAPGVLSDPTPRSSAGALPPPTENSKHSSARLDI
jgi:hypothetical protein